MFLNALSSTYASILENPGILESPVCAPKEKPKDQNELKLFERWSGSLNPFK